MLDDALVYATERGWSILPVDDKKHPLTKNGVKDASKDPDVIRQWWGRWPAANIGVATGQVSKLVVADADIKNNGVVNWETIVVEHGGLTTLKSITPSGGGHSWFLAPPWVVRNSVSSLAPGVDIRGDRGYVVAPPSILPNGPYRWVDPTAEPIELPNWLAQMLNTANHQDLPTGEVLEGVSQGRRDIAAFTLARRLRAAGVPKDMVHRMVSIAAMNSDPPLDEAVAHEKVERVFREFSKQYQFSDKGNGDRLIDRHGDLLLRVMAGESASWAIYQDGYWQIVSPDVVMYYAVENTEAILSDALALPSGTDEERLRRANYISFALKSQSFERMNAVVRIAGSNQSIMVERGSMDRDPWLLNCPNGTVDLRSGQLRVHSREDYITHQTMVPYDPDAQCPGWEQQMERVFPDPGVRGFVERALGYSVTGSTVEQVMFFAYGTGANGKTTLLATAQKILGGYARTGSADILLLAKNEVHPTGVADLVGARFVPTAEIDKDRWMAEAQLKNMTGGDTIKARFMFKDYFQYVPQFKIWMMGNHKPSVRGTDVGIWRRILMVPFTVRFTDEEKIKDYGNILYDREAPGILAWLVRACRKWIDMGLDPPPAVREATQKYREDEDILAEFRTMALEPDPSGKVPATEVYIAYGNHCKLANERPLTLHKFNRSLEEDGGLSYTRGGGNQKYWVGARLSQSGKELLSMGVGITEVNTFRNSN